MPSEILPGIWIGYGSDIFNKKFLINKKINSIISTIKFKTDLELIHLPLSEDDKLNNLFIDYINDIILYIHQKNINYKNILIYCKSGEQISPSVMVCYLIKYGKILPIEAIKIIKSKCNKAFIDNCVLIPSINTYYNRIQFQ
jgi:hypothetical protein